ncbi:MAG: VWA domain-containing protein [Nanoarchaeota archaeon]|nr:VWA domain-containing protein [Nanoarchaeota archaeon]
MDVTFNNPQFLWFLLALPLMAIAHYYDWKYKKKEALMFSNFEAAARVFEPTAIPSYPLQLTLRILVFLCLVFSAAGMNFWYVGPSTDINFALAIDTSSSMSAEDIKPSRISVAKESASEFVDSLPILSEVAVVSFAGTSFAEQVLTADKGKAKEAIRNIELKHTGGTDIGSAIITASNLLLTGKENPKSVVLLTDGQSTVGMQVEEAVDYAKNLFVTVNTIGIGTTEGGGFFGEEDALTQLDEKTLQEIANSTDGKYYKATTKEELQNIYKEISKEVYKDVRIGLTSYLISIVLLLLILNWVLTFTRFSTLP